ncbi:MAG: PstS family phosphate ABC transporter substrate-binding protein [Anaerolineaceae bacterium]|nr:PstS family phosphate ABC transporter substrate-binding protein [Anaerolineaceae bacterium]
MQKSRLAMIITVVLAVLMATSAFAQVLPEVDPLDVTGDIVSAGSSTVFPLAERIAEEFRDGGYMGEISIDEIGSGAGFERFCVAGETDISNASRAIKDSEIESCEAIGRTPIEFRVGTDALTVAVSSENDFVSDVTAEELALIFSTAATWADVRAEWPAEPIQRFIPGTDSGTFDFFVEEIFDEDEAPILAASNTQLSENDNVLVQGIQGSPYAIGFFGFAYYIENADTLNAVSIGGVAPTAETAEDGSYPLARPLFIYSDATIMAEKPQVADFINYFLTHVNDVIVEVGYFPASDDALNGARDAWLEAMMMGMPMVELPAVDPLDVTGDIVSAGSSTVFPLAERIAEEFRDGGYMGEISIDEIGSGAGFERFCVAGETDISNASRAIKDSEIESCEAIGRTPIEFRVGTDALTVAVSSENDFVSDVTAEELALIFSTAATWADVRAEWPAEPIQRFIPGTDSGTFDFFVEEIFDEDEAPILAASNTQLSENDNVLVQGIQGSPYAIGFFGFAYYIENADTLNAVSIDGVAPTAETAEDGSYPLARPLFIYSDATIMAEKPQVADFINYFLTNVNDVIVEVGYFPASDDALNGARDAWLEAMMMGQ